MEIKVYNKKGEMVAERHYFPESKSSDNPFLLSEESKGVYFVNIIYDGIMKTRKLTIR
jgi:hypothetical protein